MHIAPDHLQPGRYKLANFNCPYRHQKSILVTHGHRCCITRRQSRIGTSIRTSCKRMIVSGIASTVSEQKPGSSAQKEEANRQKELLQERRTSGLTASSSQSEPQEHTLRSAWPGGSVEICRTITLPAKVLMAVPGTPIPFGSCNLI